MVKRIVFGYGGVLVGVIITAVGVSFFSDSGENRRRRCKRPGNGSVSFDRLPPVGITMLLLNGILFILAWRVLGPVFGAKTLFGTVTLSIFIDFLSKFSVPITGGDLLLISIYGGVISGIGLGIAFRAGGSTGGTDLAAQLVAKFFPTTVGQALLFVDGFVIIIAGLAFGIELALYALIAVFITTKAIDVVVEGQSFAKAALIISDYPEAVGQAIVDRLERGGVTSLDGRGFYTKHDKEVLLVIVSLVEIAEVKQIVREYDERAFVIIGGDVHEVLGEGFRRL